jgi:hypothetical protein
MLPIRNKLLYLQLFGLSLAISFCGSPSLNKEISLILPAQIKRNLSWINGNATYTIDKVAKIELSLIDPSRLLEISDYYYKEKGKYRNLPLMFFKIKIRNLSPDVLEFQRWNQFIHLFSEPSGSGYLWLKTESSWAFYMFLERFSSDSYKRFAPMDILKFFSNAEDYSEELYQKQKEQDEQLLPISLKELKKKSVSYFPKHAKDIYFFPATRYDRFVIFPQNSVLTLIAWDRLGPEVKEFLLEINLIRNNKDLTQFYFPFEQSVYRRDFKD